MSDDVQPGPLTAPQRNLETRILEEVLEADLSESQELIARHLQALDADQKGSAFESFLQSLWNHFEGVRVVTEEGNFNLGMGLEAEAAAGLQQLGIKELESTARALSTYFEAAVEASQLNLNRSMELFASTEDYLRDAGRFGRKFQGFIDHMKPAALFLGAVPALMARDFGTARALVSQASEMARKVAVDYHEEGSPPHFTFLGMASLYEAVYSHYQAQIDLSNLDLDKFASADISASAREAVRLLAQADLANAQVRTQYHVARALVDILEVTKGIAVRMDLCFKAALKPDLQGFRDLKSMSRRAIDHAAKAGPQAVPFSKDCDALLIRIHNLEQLAQPRKSDFGIYSGLISCAIFVAVLIIASWARSAFGLDLEGKTFFLTIVGLALIGGFGFGALRFKSLFLPARAE